MPRSEHYRRQVKGGDRASVRQTFFPIYCIDSSTSANGRNVLSRWVTICLQLIHCRWLLDMSNVHLNRQWLLMKQLSLRRRCCRFHEDADEWNLVFKHPIWLLCGSLIKSKEPRVWVMSNVKFVDGRARGIRLVFSWVGRATRGGSGVGGTWAGLKHSNCIQSVYVGSWTLRSCSTAV